MTIRNEPAPHTIFEFRGAFRFLSNFHPAVVTLDGVEYRTVENAYQAAKSDSRTHRNLCRVGSPGDAKRIGQQVTLRPDWDDVKDGVMLDLLRQKFAHEDLGRLLRWTNNAILREGNSWGDTYWGVDHVKGGQNKLGKLLMQVREELRSSGEDTL